MGQVLRAMTYNRDSEPQVEVLTIGSTPLVWTGLEDTVMGGKSTTALRVENEKSLIFEGTIDTRASVGWASARARLPDTGLPAATESLHLSVQGDGKTYKVILMDANHENRFWNNPLWEADLPTMAGIKETATLRLENFTPSFMGRQLTKPERAKYSLEPTKLTKVGFMLSSRLSDGTSNPVETYGTGTFNFSLRIDSIDVMTKTETAPKE